MDWLSGPHVARAWFGEFDLPSGYQYLHNGVGTVTVGGHDWVGVSNPIGGQMVGISAVEDPRFGTAAKVDIQIGGVDVAFYRSVKADARNIEGRTAILRIGVFDPETQDGRIFKPMLPGKISSPSLQRGSDGTRIIGLTIEGFWQAQNFPFGGKWSAADQQKRYPGDKGLMYVGQEVAEQWL